MNPALHGFESRGVSFTSRSELGDHGAAKVVESDDDLRRSAADWAQVWSFLPVASGAARVGNVQIVAGDEMRDTLWQTNLVTNAWIDVRVEGAVWDDLEDLTPYRENLFFGVTSLSRKKNGRRDPAREKLLLFERQSGSRIRVMKSWPLRDLLPVETRGDFKLVG